MIQDIQPHIYHNEYTPVKPQKTDLVFAYSGKNVFVKEDHSFPLVSDYPEDTALQYLFRIDDTCFFLADTGAVHTVEIPVNDMRRYDPEYLGFAAVTGWQLYNWYNENRYCGVCGKEMKHDEKERAMKCTECGHIVYPKIMPCIIAGVINNKGQIALTRYAHQYKTTYALIAGFCEIGETAEETVKREVKEEIGVDVEDLVYYKCQPWSFSSTLLFGYYCHVKGSDEITLDRNELKEAVWMSPEEIPQNLDPGSLTAEMIMRFGRGEVK